jgi:hypothetical protein
MAVGYIIRSDGYRCDLCDRHQREDWNLTEPKDGCTLGRYPIVDRNPRYTCQRIIPDIEFVLVTPRECETCGAVLYGDVRRSHVPIDEGTSGYPKRDVKFAGVDE